MIHPAIDVVSQCLTEKSRERNSQNCCIDHSGQTTIDFSFSQIRQSKGSLKPGAGVIGFFNTRNDKKQRVAGATGFLELYGRVSSNPRTAETKTLLRL